MRKYLNKCMGLKKKRANSRAKGLAVLRPGQELYRIEAIDIAVMGGAKMPRARRAERVEMLSLDFFRCRQLSVC